MLAGGGGKAIWICKGVHCDWAIKNGVTRMEGIFDARPAHSLPPAPCKEEDLAVLMPTSGSTGGPRLAMVSHGNLRANTEAIVGSQRLVPDDQAMLILPVRYCV